jgi:serine/threonine-protein kinase
MGEVFSAKRLDDGVTVALKVLRAQDADRPSDAVARFHREALVIGSINHPAICKFYGVGALPDGNPYLVLERLTGLTLHARLRSRSRMSQTMISDIFGQILTAIHVVHSAGIVHRDLKPANVFLVRNEHGAECVKLIDFGFAKDIVGRLDNMTRPGRACGTPSYMAPEQLFGRAVDARSDLFCVGVMLFEAITQHHPFAGPTSAAISMNIVSEPAPSASSWRTNIAPALDAFLQRALEKSPSGRFASALEMQAALAAIPDWGLDETDLRSLPRLSASLLPAPSASSAQSHSSSVVSSG